MSKRTANCDHPTWDILPGGNIRCDHCGEEIEPDDITDWVNDEDGVIEITARPKPLTYHLKDLNIVEGGSNG